MTSHEAPQLRKSPTVNRENSRNKDERRGDKSLLSLSLNLKFMRTLQRTYTRARLFFLRNIVRADEVFSGVGRGERRSPRTSLHLKFRFRRELARIKTMCALFARFLRYGYCPRWGSHSAVGASSATVLMHFGVLLSADAGHICRG